MVTTSGTYLFAPSTAEVILSAFARLQIKRAAVIQEHMLDGQREANFWLSSLANRGPNLWAVDLQTVSLVQGTPTYTIPPETVMILDMYIETTDTAGNLTDRNISPLNRSDYASLPNKLQEGQPTSFWFDRLIAPTISVWPCPDANGPYTLKYYRYRQVQDANLANGQNAELPYLFLDAFVAALAHRLSRIYAPTLEQIRKADADEAWMIASTQNTESAPFNMSPSMDSYFR
jgi:hypothetical protein